LLCFFILWIRDLSKIFGKSWNIFLKNIDIWNLKFFINSTIYYLFFYFITIFEVFFSYFTYANLSKILNIFVVFYYTDYRFYQRILENSSILIKKNRDIVNTKHFHNSIVHYLLFNFLVFLTSFFLVYPSMVFKKFLKFLCCFIVWIRDFIKNFSKTMVFFFKKNWDIWNPKFQQNSKILTKFHLYSFFFISFSIFSIFFLFHISKLVKKLGNFL